MGPRQRAKTPADFSSRIKALREQHGLTQTRLAELLGVSFASVNRWENGQTCPAGMAWQRILQMETHGIRSLSEEVLSVNEAKEDSPEYEVPPTADFLASADHVWIAAEAERLTHGHLFNPAFATETSLIDPLPHQRIAVYDRMLTQPRLRFLLADDAGAGKTIMSGLYIREVLCRRLVRRILIVPPAGLLGNWERELRTLFGLHFKIVVGSDATRQNPFVGPGSDLVIVSVDTLAGDRIFSRLQDEAVVPYDLVIFDECHKLSARQEPDFRIRKTARYCLAEALCGATTNDSRWSLPWSCTHTILLSATPHMGKDFPYYYLWRVLEPDIFSTQEAFEAFPQEERSRHFIRRTKEEMVTLDGKPLYPKRISDTFSYDLNAGPHSEQQLYDEVTSYIRTYYNKARMLNRSAARFAMGVFQRRLASSTYAILCSLKRREEKIARIIDDLVSGRISEEQLQLQLQNLDDYDYDEFDDRTADEEEPVDGQEANEEIQEAALGGVIALNLADLMAEREQVKGLVHLTQRVYEGGQESKFERLRDIFEDPRFKNEKVIIFTEHRDTLVYLVKRLEGIGFAGRVATIHGGMGYKERDEQKDSFRKPASEGGAQFLVATDAAGEGINLQFSWIMVNFDIPWNPARLEQRMGRIHRYGQQHDPVFILNLIAGKTREGRVLKTLLDKLEKIRKNLGSDKVFDVIGRLFDGVSMRDYMHRAMESDADAEGAAHDLEGLLTEEQVKALQAREKTLYGDGGEVKAALPEVREQLEREQLRRLLPGYVRRFVERAAPFLSLKIEGDLDGHFQLLPATSGAMDPLWSVLDLYSLEQRLRFTCGKPGRDDSDNGIWLHPGDRFFDEFRDLAAQRFRAEALRGAIFVDPCANKPYLFHLGIVKVIRRSDPAFPALAYEETLECQLAGIRQTEDGSIEPCPVEHFLLLKGGQGIPAAAQVLRAKAPQFADAAQNYARTAIALPLAEQRRASLLADLSERKEFVRKGFDYQEAELAGQRSVLSQRVRTGDRNAKRALDAIKTQQKFLASRREDALAVLHREPELIEAVEFRFVAHALVIPSADAEEKARFDAEVEAIAMQVAIGHEESLGASVADVSMPSLARTAGLDDWCGFDLKSRRPNGDILAIEVKGRLRSGEIEMKQNEWAKACNLGDRYWLYVVFDCATTHPRLIRIQNPFQKLLAKAQGGVLINASQLYAAAEGDI